ncbi:hypothetical protein GGR28_003542 [Lewinella aquimaris]|uniref:Uncharacterized protein n=1 Tax=Neolewinella aquimaris TaxID=1835722 RepID=A0A840EAD1_9BACT|nr:hypothetical protein [Neolewinella aquimaris]MBB4080903.1 hypothetical protein [Neolewinella aquimaris]
MPTSHLTREELKSAMRALLIREPELFFEVVQELREEVEGVPASEHATEQEKWRAMIEEEFIQLGEVFRGFA